MGTQLVDHDKELDLMCLPAGTLLAEVRQRMDLRLAGWGLDRIAHDAHHIAAELIANAMAETPAQKIRIRCTREPATLTFAVWDASNRMPMARPVVEMRPEDLDLAPENFDRNGGWGLTIVQALAAEYGVSVTEPHGKWVWARLAIP